jgi:uncharacterized RDD family membrane protein YckC
MTTGPEAGYYADPSIPGYIRYWDGTQWVAGTSRPAQELLDQQQGQQRQQAVQQAVAAQLAPAVQPQFQPQAQPQSQPQPQPRHGESAAELTSVSTMVVPSAFGNRGSYGGAGNPFAAIPGLYREAEPEEEAESDVRVVELASAGSRILARIIDLAIAVVVSIPATATLLLLAHRHDHVYVEQLRLQAKTTYRTLGLDAMGIALWASAVVVVLITAAIFEAYRLPRTGQTVGRRLVGVQVVTVGTAGDVPGGAATARAFSFWLLALIPLVDILALGGILWGRPYRQGLHEKLSGTLSIRA